MKIDRQRFAEVLLSRFLTANSAARWEIFQVFSTASVELMGLQDHDSKEFKEWSATLKELLFPESIGDINFGKMSGDTDDEE